MYGSQKRLMQLDRAKVPGESMSFSSWLLDYVAIGEGRGLEGVEGDADWQNDLQGGGVHGDAEAVPGGDPVLDEEVGVLEVAEDAKVDGEGDPQPAFLALPVTGLFNADADEEVNEGGEGDEPEEAPVPPAVEDVGGDQQQEVQCPQMAMSHEPIQPEDNR